MNDPWGECVGAGIVGGCANGDHAHCTGGVHVDFQKYVRCTCSCHARKPDALTGVQPGQPIVIPSGDTFAAQATSEFGPGDTTTQPEGEVW